MLGFARRGLGVSLVGALCLGALLSGAAASSGGRSVEIRHAWMGQPGATYGGAVSELRDIDRDGATDAIIGVPGHVGSSGAFDGQVEVRSGRTGDLLHLLQGPTGSRFGYSIADAGDVDGDRVHDIAVGAPGGPRCVVAVGPGRAYVYSGRTGEQILVVSGEAPTDFFGAAIGAAGDVNRDGHADVLVGAPCADGPGGVNAGAAYVVSGKDASILRTHDGADTEDRLGGWPPISTARAWLLTFVATAASTYALDAVATAAGVLLVASGLLGGFDHRLLLAFLVGSYVLWGAGLRVNLKANWVLLEETGTSTNVFSKAAYDLARAGTGVPGRKVAAAAGYVGTELAKEAPYYAGAFGAAVLSDSLSANEALVFLAGTNLGAAAYEYGLGRLTRVFLRLRSASPPTRAR